MRWEKKWVWAVKYNVHEKTACDAYRWFGKEVPSTLMKVMGGLEEESLEGNNK